MKACRARAFTFSIKMLWRVTNSKEWNNCLIKLPKAVKFERYPFVLNVSIKVLRPSKRDLEREISTPVDRDWIFFLAEVLKYKASRWSILSRQSLNKIRPRVFHSIITVIHFSRAIKLYKGFYKIVSRNYELRKFWSVDYSSCFDFRYFPSHSTTPRIKLSCKSVNWQYAVISGPAVT